MAKILSKVARPFKWYFGVLKVAVSPVAEPIKIAKRMTDTTKSVAGQMRKLTCPYCGDPMSKHVESGEDKVEIITYRCDDQKNCGKSIPDPGEWDGDLSTQMHAIANQRIQSLSDKEFKNIISNTKLLSRTAYTFSVLSCAFFAYTFTLQGMSMSTAISLIFAVAGFSNGFRYAYRNWQVINRKVYSVGALHEFKAQPRAWFI
jgi:hypothetical protein